MAFLKESKLSAMRAKMCRGSQWYSQNFQSHFMIKVNTSISAFQSFRGSLMPGTRLYATAATIAETQGLVSWIENDGGRCESLHIATDEKNGQTLIASREIRKGKQLVLLPQTCQLKAFSSDPVQQNLIDSVPPELWAARLALPVSIPRNAPTWCLSWI